MIRRQCLRSVIAAVLAASVPWLAAAQQPSGAPGGSKTIAVLEIELVDDQNNQATLAAQEVRLRNGVAQLRRELSERGLYRVADDSPSSTLQQTMRSQQAFFYRCDSCAVDVGRQLGVDLVMTPWVQKVSELILNFNVQIFDVKTQQMVFTKSVDLRGNQDESWTRAIAYLVRGMAERRALNPGYAQ